VQVVAVAVGVAPELMVAEQVELCSTGTTLLLVQQIQVVVVVVHLQALLRVVRTAVQAL
jgi:hypothetical protein